MMRQIALWGYLFLGLLLIACNRNNTPDPSQTTESETAVIPPITITETATQPPSPVPTATPIPPTPTPAEPLAALVNDEPVYLSDYERELSRYEQSQAELSLPLEDNYRQIVLDALIERTLITQAALNQSLYVSPEMVDAKLNELKAATGNPTDFAAWLQANQWTEDEFRDALQVEMLVEQMVAAVTADVPYAVEQVHARYIQVDDAALAQSLLAEVQANADFAFLAQQHSLDRLTAQVGGDLGFFARGSLLVPEVEEAAFNLQPNETSDLIVVEHADTGPTYYLVQVIEIDPERPLTANLRYTLLQQTFEEWLAQQWTNATIQRFI